MKKALLIVVVLAFVLSPLHNLGVNQAEAATLNNSLANCIGTRCTTSCPLISCASSSSIFKSCSGTFCLSSPARTSQNRTFGFYRSTPVKR